MIASFQRALRPTPEQEREMEEQVQRLTEKLIEKQDCIFCKHASLNESKYPTPYCLLMNEFVGSRRGIEKDQLCMFWEYCDMEERC